MNKTAHKPRRTRRPIVMVLTVLALGTAVSWLQSSMSIISACYPDGLLTNVLLLNGNLIYWPPRQGMIALTEDRGRVQYRSDDVYCYFTVATFEHGVTTVDTFSVFVASDEHEFWQINATESKWTLSPPAWSLASRLRPDSALIQRRPVAKWTEIVSGWPLKSFRGTVPTKYGSYGMQYSYEWCFPLGPPTNPSVRFHQPVIPYRPMPGLIINAALYGTACLVPIAVFRSGHRRRRAARRTRAGLCPACAYPAIGLTTCPECATPVPPRPTKRSRRTRTRPPR